jgi:hypothetical protein
MSGHERIWLQPGAETTWCQHRINDDDVEYVRADIAASPAPTVSGEVAVKPLEWEDREPYTYKGYWHKVWRAVNKLFGDYRIDYSWKVGTQEPDPPTFHVWMSGAGESKFPTLDTAKAAAQAEYEQCIRSALLPAPTRDDVLSVDEIEAIIIATEPAGLSDNDDKIWTRRMAVALARSLKGGKS